jgi:hypothetical protein
MGEGNIGNVVNWQGALKKKDTKQAGVAQRLDSLT